MRTLESTGIGLLPFMNARDVLGVPLELMNARHRPGTRPNGDPVTQVAFSFAIINPMRADYSGWVTPDGDDIPVNFVVTLESNEGRAQYVAYFERERESIGPVQLQQLPGKNGQSGAFVLEPWEAAQPAPAAPASLPEPQSVPAATVTAQSRPRGQRPAPVTRTRSAPPPAADDVLDDVPF